LDVDTGWEWPLGFVKPFYLDLLRKYITSQEIPRPSRQSTIRLAEGLEVAGFAQAVKKVWNATLHCAHPYFCSLFAKTFPRAVEPGFTCGDCLRDRLRPIQVFFRTKDLSLCQAYLRGQIATHLMECPTAQDIVNGKYLTIVAESNLI
jgi:hypothetical protein